MKKIVTQILPLSVAFLGITSTSTAQNSLPVSGSDYKASFSSLNLNIDDYNKVVQPDGTVYWLSKAPKTLKAEGEDLVTVTFQLDGYDKDNTQVIKGIAQANFYKDGKYVVNTSTNTAKIPTGTYDILAGLNVPTAAQVKYKVAGTAFDIFENINITKDTTIILSAYDLKNRIGVKPYYKNGQAITSGSYDIDNDKYIDSANYVYSNYIELVQYVPAHSGPVVILTSSIDFKRYSGGALAAYWDPSILISDGSDKFTYYFSGVFQPKGNDVHPVAIGLAQSGFSKDNTLANDPQKTTELALRFKRSTKGLEYKSVRDGIGSFFRNQGIQYVGQINYDLDEDGVSPERKYDAGVDIDNLSSSAWQFFFSPMDLDFYGKPNPHVPNNVEFYHRGGTWTVKDGKAYNKITPLLSFYGDNVKGVLGNNVPVISFKPEFYVNPTTNKKVYAVREARYYGRYGEYNESSTGFITKMGTVSGDGIKPSTGLSSTLINYLNTNTASLTGNVNVVFYNNIVKVDSIPGLNTTELGFDATKDDNTPPTVTYLQFSKPNGDVTDRFDTNSADDKFGFAAGDFTYIESTNSAPLSGNLKNVKVSYSPNGKDSWKNLSFKTNDTDVDDTYGYSYTGNLADVDVASENKWYDLKIEITDNAGNYQIQTIAPAFRIENIIADGTNKIDEVSTNKAIKSVSYYNVLGIEGKEPFKGVNIVVTKYADGTTHSAKLLK